MRLLVGWGISLALAGALAVTGAIIALPADSSSPPVFELTVSPSGDDGSCARNGSACATFDRAYQLAASGDAVEVLAGRYASQVIKSRADLRGGTCTTTDTSQCVVFTTEGAVKIDGVLEIRGSGILVDGRNQLDVTGYTDTEADSNTTHPDHVVVQNLHTTSFGIFNADTVTFKNLDVGPAYVGTGTPGNYRCTIEQGNGFENKIGFGGDVTPYVPRNVVLDGLRIHDQNSNNQAAREQADCHYGGLFIVTVDGLTIRNTVFERNVVYHVQLQNFGGAPAAKRVLFDNNSFGCPVDWKYRGDVCDGQRAIQFDYDPGAEVTLTNNVAANGKSWDGSSGLYGCYVGTCGGLAGLKVSGNVDLPDTTTAPPLLTRGPNPPSPPSPPSPSPLPPSPPAKGICDNGVDDDGDGKTDLADPGCSSHADTDEADPSPPGGGSNTPPPITPAPSPDVSACDNGVDDDGDGKIDLADPGCSSHTDTNETDPAAQGDAPAAAASPQETSPLNGTSVPATQPASADLRRGDSGEGVQALQAALEKLGYAPGGVDGKFGPLTEHALIAFQKVEGLAPDGVADTNTIVALNAALAHG